MKRKLMLSIISLLSIGTLINHFKNRPSDESIITLDISGSKHTELSSLSSPASLLYVDRAEAKGGFCYVIYKDFGLTGDSATQPTASTLKIYENGMELGPAHTRYSTIKNQGGGRYSHSGNELYFSASDNTDPRTNGRIYTYTIGDTGPIVYANVIVQQPAGKE